tara:strand:- start:638 stop:877 length:240 start_codon:yes stop_codon:yes gene_type:complete
MADNNIVVIDGIFKKLTDAEFETEFGHSPTTPRDGERSFSGRYEHATFNTGSVSGAGFQVDDSAEKNTGITLFSVSGSL